MQVTPAELRPWAVLSLSEARGWADAVREPVRALVGPEQAPLVASVSVQEGEENASPYGPFLGSWIESEDSSGPVIRVLENWAHPFWLMFYHTPELLEGCPSQDAWRRCRIRLRMGVTNDVWQPFVPGPTSGYSMVRHHALMLAGAWTWLPSEDQREWQYVLEMTSQRALSLFGGGRGSVMDQITGAERKATAVWAALPHRRTETADAVLADFYLWASVAVAVLVQPLSELDGASQQAQLKNWMVDHRERDFNQSRMEEAWRRLQRSGSLWA